MGILRGILTVFASEQDNLKKTVENLPNHSDPTQTEVTNIFSTVYGIAGVLAVLFLIWGGTQYILAAGNPQKAAKAKSTILYSIVGLVIVVLAAAITFFVTQVAK